MSNGIYIDFNKRLGKFQLVQDEDGYVYDKKFTHEISAQQYLVRISKNIEKVTNNKR